MHEPASPLPAVPRRRAVRNRILFPRREVANTVRLRQRKGTLAALQDVATATSGWPTRVVEIAPQLGLTQNVSYLHPTRGRTIDLREGAALDELQTAFNTAAQTIDLRPGRVAAVDVRAYVWRLGPYSITKAPAYCYEEASPNSFLFNPLGIDTPLFTRPQPPRGTRTCSTCRRPSRVAACTTSRLLRRGQELPDPAGDAAAALPPDQIVAADLTDWTYRPLPGQVAVDPELGRIAFPPRRRESRACGCRITTPSARTWAAANTTRAAGTRGTFVYRVGDGEAFTRIADALTRWQTDKPPAAAIELTDSGVYVEPIRISLGAVSSSCSVPRNGARPVLRMLDWQNALPDSLSVYGEAGSWFTLDGLVVIGRGVQLDGDMAGAVIRHATLVPGWAMHCNCEPKRPTEPSLEVNGNVGCLTIDHSITGAIEVNRDQVRTDPLAIRICDSIVDATSTERTAIIGPAASARTRRSRSRAARSSGTSRSTPSSRPRTASSWGRSGLPAPAGLPPLLLRDARLAHAAPLRMPARSRRSSRGRPVHEGRHHGSRARRAARPRAPARGAGIQQHALRRSDLWPADRYLRAGDHARRRGPVGDGRVSRSVSAAAGGEPAGAARGVCAREHRDGGASTTHRERS